GRASELISETPAKFTDLAKARAFAHEHLAVAVAFDMVSAGAPLFEVHERWHEQTVDIDGLALFVEGTLTLAASGRPELSRS
ncbi:MAG: hypothetical protein WCI22_18805, partial [Actinomycetota bacterium]